MTRPQQAAIDRAFLAAASALDYHAANRTPDAWDRMFGAIVDELGRHVSRRARAEADAEHDEAGIDRGRY